MGASIENNKSRYMVDLTNFIWHFNLDTVFCSLKRAIRSREVRYIEGLLYVRNLTVCYFCQAPSNLDG
jgi:hypothetical protein